MSTVFDILEFMIKVKHAYLAVFLLIVSLELQILRAGDHDDGNVTISRQKIFGSYISKSTDEFEQLAQYLFGHEKVLAGAMLYNRIQQIGSNANQRNLDNDHFKTANYFIELLHKTYRDTVVMLSSASTLNNTGYSDREALKRIRTLKLFLASIEKGITAHPLPSEILESLISVNKLRYEKLKYYAHVEKPPRTIQQMNALDRQLQVL